MSLSKDITKQFESSVSVKNFQDEEEVEVGESLIFTERVYLAWFIRVSLLKIRSVEAQKLGASFIA